MNDDGFSPTIYQMADDAYNQARKFGADHADSLDAAVDAVSEFLITAARNEERTAIVAGIRGMDSPSYAQHTPNAIADLIASASIRTDQ